MKIYNTLSGQKEEFMPYGDPVKMYVCGVTPYDNSHFGHAMSYIFFNVIRRYLKYRGYKVKYVQNVTDIEDKIIMRANQRSISTTELAEKYTASFFEDMDALNMTRPDVTPRATEEVPKIIEVIQGLIEKGYAYKTPDGSVYFRVTRDADYGQAFPSHSGYDAGRGSYRGRRAKRAPDGLCSLEGGSNPESHPGRVPGARAGPAGISNAPPCR